MAHITMKVYDYFKSIDDMKRNNICASFTEIHDRERRAFESLNICSCMKVREI